jgi:excisionase family DNA binding protein
MRRRKETAVTVEQACDAIGVSRSTLWRMIRRGELPSFRQSGRRLVPLHALSVRQVRLRAKKAKPFTLEHPLWRLVGAFRSGGAGPGSGDKHEILAK